MTAESARTGIRRAGSPVTMDGGQLMSSFTLLGRWGVCAPIGWGAFKLILILHADWPVFPRPPVLPPPPFFHFLLVSSLFQLLDDDEACLRSS